MKVNPATAAAILRTLPIGYYAGMRAPVTLSETAETSAIDLMKREIVVSFKNVETALSGLPENAPADVVENAIRNELYHETAHLMLTPRSLIPYDFVNILEDERIETLTRNLFHGVKFRESIRLLNGYGPAWRPTTARSFLFGIARFRTGPKEFLSRLDEIIAKHADKNCATGEDAAFDMMRDYAAFWNDIQAYWNDHSEELKNPPAPPSPPSPTPPPPPEDGENAGNPPPPPAEDGKPEDEKPGKPGEDADEKPGDGATKPGEDGDADETDENGDGKPGETDGKPGDEDGDEDADGKPGEDADEDADGDGRPDGENGDGTDGDDADGETGAGDADGEDGDGENGEKPGDGATAADEDGDADTDGDTDGDGDGENAADADEDGEKPDGDGKKPGEDGEKPGENGENGETDGEDANGTPGDNGGDGDGKTDGEKQTSEDLNGTPAPPALTPDQLAAAKEAFAAVFNSRTDTKTEAALSRLFVAATRKRAPRTGVSYGYAGRVDPFAVAARTDYRWMVKPGDNGAGKFDRVHVRLWIDTSGSMDGNMDKVNGLVAALLQLEKRMPGAFSVAVIESGNFTRPHEKTEELHACGGNDFGPGVVEAERATRRQNWRNINIAVWDGYMMDAVPYDGKAGLPRFARELVKKNARIAAAFRALDGRDTVIVSDEINKDFFNEGCPRAKKQFLADEGYVDSFVAAVLEMLGRVL